MWPLFVAFIVALAGLALLIYLPHLHLRRSRAQDYQNILHFEKAYHVVIFFGTRNGEKVIATAHRFVHSLVTETSATLIYAGQADTAMESSQPGKRHWDGVLLFQFPSRSNFEGSAATRIPTMAAELFGQHYINGMRRKRSLCLTMTAELFRLRLRNLLRGQWRQPALQEQPGFRTLPGFRVWHERAQRLRALHTINPDALVIFSLNKQGNAMQRVANDEYGRQMMERMAGERHGPLHRGKFIRLQGSSRFNEVNAVHYPSADYFADLISSQFFHSIVGQKQVADAMTVPTVPITDLVKLANSA